MQELSIKNKISIHVIIMLAIIVAIISSVAYIEFKEAVIRGIDEELKSDVGSINLLLSSEESFSNIHKDINIVLNNKADKRLVGYGVWIDGQEEYISKSDSFSKIKELVDFEAVEKSNDKNIKFFDLGYENNTYRGAWANFSKALAVTQDNKNINILIFINPYSAWHEINEFMRMLLVTSIIAITITTVLIIYIIKWGLAPIHSITNQMSESCGNDLFDLKFNILECPKELKPFVDSWNQLITKLSVVMNQQKQFTADASHELRTPLAVIKSTLQICRFQKRSLDFYESSIDKCLSEMIRMENLISQLLELAECDEDAFKNNQCRENLKNLILAACDTFAEKANQKNQTINMVNLFDFSFDCFPEHLIRAFSNLIENAIKYGPSDSYIYIKMQKSDGNIEIMVQDEGGKINAEECDVIFDRFYKTDKAREHKSGGAGLGLAITKAIIEKHNGTISVKSNPTDGTVFTVTFPGNP